MGKQRVAVIKSLPDNPFTAEDFRKRINSEKGLKLSLREMSRHLTSFTKEKLLRCLNPQAPYSRLYLITENGKKIKNKIINTCFF